MRTNLHTNTYTPRPARSARPMGRAAAALVAGAAAAAVLPMGTAYAQQAPAGIPLPGDDARVPVAVDDQVRFGDRSVAHGFDTVFSLERIGRYDSALVRGRVGSSTRLVRVKDTGKRVPLARRVSSAASDPADRRVAAALQRSRRDVVKVKNLGGGKLVAKRRFVEPTVLALAGRDVTLTIGSTERRRVVTWDIGSDSVERVTRGNGIDADPRADRLVLSEGLGDVSVVALSSPSQEIDTRGELPVDWSFGGESVLTVPVSATPFHESVVARAEPSYAAYGRITTDRTGDRMGLGPVWESRFVWLTVRYDDDKAFIQRCNRRATSCERASEVFGAETVGGRSGETGALASPRLVLGSRS